MKPQLNFRPLGCSECVRGTDLDFDFTMAFQPIVDIRTREIFAYEALVRGLNNESAGQVFEHVNDSNRYRFDQCCRVKAVQLAAELGVPCFLSINFMPNAVYRAELCIRTTLAAADAYGFPAERIIFEITEGEKVTDVPHLKEIVQHYQSCGFKTAIDDFGAGYAGLNLLVDVRVDIVKLDMHLIRGIEADPVRQAMVKGLAGICAELGTTVIAEGVETAAELQTLKSYGIHLFQGYYLARPAFRALAALNSAL